MPTERDSRPLLTPALGRRLLPEHQKALASYSRKAGKVNWAWAMLHDRLAILFATLLAPSGSDIIPGLLFWDTLRNDSAARRQLAELCILFKRQNRGNKRLLDNTLWVIKNINNLAEYRNEMAHGAVNFLYDNPKETLPGVVKMSLSYKFIQTKNVIFRPNSLWGDFYVLSNFVTALLRNAAFPEMQEPLPRRPRLLSLSKDQKGNTRKSRRRAKARPPQPPSSQP